jgi:hypothetical protein
MTKYAFKTIVAPEAVRNEFTALRDSLNSSDKELMQAFWNLGIDRLEDIKREVEMLQAESAAERLVKKELKQAAKPQKAKKIITVHTDAVEVGEDDDDTPCLVIDGVN